MGADVPYVAGLTGEWMVTPNVALGIDRVGWTRQSAADSRWNFGSRVSFAIDGDRWRPYAFVAGGGRVIETATRESAAALPTSAGPPRCPATPPHLRRHRREPARGRGGGGLGVRYYVTPATSSKRKRGWRSKMPTPACSSAAASACTSADEPQPTTLRATATRLGTLSPSFSLTTLPGALAPKRSMPIAAPRSPT